MSYAAVQVPGRRGGALVTRIARIIEQTERGMVRVALLEDVPPLAGEDVFPVSGVPRMEESGETQEVHLHRISHNVLVVSTAQVGNNSVLVFPGIKGLYRSTQPVVDVITAGSDADKVTASRLVQLWHVFHALQKAMRDLGNHVGPGEVRTDKFAATEDFVADFVGHLQRGEPHESQVRVRQSESNRMQLIGDVALPIPVKLYSCVRICVDSLAAVCFRVRHRTGATGDQARSSCKRCSCRGSPPTLALPP